MNYIQEPQIDRQLEEPQAIANTIMQYPHHTYPQVMNYFIP
jgi:hypothetical protein